MWSPWAARLPNRPSILISSASGCVASTEQNRRRKDDNSRYLVRSKKGRATWTGREEQRAMIVRRSGYSFCCLRSGTSTTPKGRRCRMTMMIMPLGFAIIPWSGWHCVHFLFIICFFSIHLAFCFVISASSVFIPALISAPGQIKGRASSVCTYRTCHSDGETTSMRKSP